MRKPFTTCPPYLCTVPDKTVSDKIIFLLSRLDRTILYFFNAIFYCRPTSFLLRQFSIRQFILLRWLLFKLFFRNFNKLRSISRPFFYTNRVWNLIFIVIVVNRLSILTGQSDLQSDIRTKKKFIFFKNLKEYENIGETCLWVRRSNFI